MPDNLTPDKRHRIMASIHSASTKPEMDLRHALWNRGFRYRVNVKGMPGKPDIVLPKYHTIIFVHGCFWHGHVGCDGSHIPQTNEEFWKSKIARNQERDQAVWRQLEARGWNVIIVWECQLKKPVFNNTIQQIEAEIISNGEQYLKRNEERKASRLAYLQERKAHKEREIELLALIKGRSND